MKVMENGNTRDATKKEIEEILARQEQSISDPVPQQVTMRQARLALLAIGKLNDVDAAIESFDSPDREAARIEWEYARDVERESPMVTMMGAALDLSEEQLDQLFIDAAKL